MFLNQNFIRTFLQTPMFLIKILLGRSFERLCFLSKFYQDVSLNAYVFYQNFIRTFLQTPMFLIKILLGRSFERLCFLSKFYQDVSLNAYVLLSKFYQDVPSNAYVFNQNFIRTFLRTPMFFIKYLLGRSFKRLCF